MLGVVFSGGGARGAHQAGVHARLAESDRFGDPGVLAGTSAGAINAALIAAGKSPDEVRDFWLGLGDDPPITVDPSLFHSGLVNFGGAIFERRRWPSKEAFSSLAWRARRHALWRPTAWAALGVEWLLARRFDVANSFLERMRQTALADTSKLREHLVATFGDEIVPAQLPLAINAVDVVRHRVVRFVNRAPRTSSPEEYVVGDITVDMVLASASIPLLFPPVKIVVDGVERSFWDGGVLANTPMAPAVALGATEIVPVLSTEEPDGATRDIASLGDAAEHLGDTLLENSYNVDRKLLLERNRRKSYASVKLYAPVRPKPREAGEFSAGSYLFFQREKLDEMFRSGRDAADRWLAEGPKEDRLEPRRPSGNDRRPRPPPPN